MQINSKLNSKPYDYQYKFSSLQAFKKKEDILNLTITQKEMFSGKLRRPKIRVVIDGDQKSNKQYLQGNLKGEVAP